MQFRLECCEDGAFTGKAVNSKSWFYFQVTGFPRNTRGRFFIAKVQALSSIFYVPPTTRSPSTPSATVRSTAWMEDSGSAWRGRFLWHYGTMGICSAPLSIPSRARSSGWSSPFATPTSTSSWCSTSTDSMTSWETPISTCSRKCWSSQSREGQCICSPSRPMTSRRRRIRPFSRKPSSRKECVLCASRSQWC
jgi:hypothetical protein